MKWKGNKRYLGIFFGLMAILMPVTSQGGVLFQDNFDSQPDWTLLQKTDQLTDCWGTESASPCDVPPNLDANTGIGWDGYFNGFSNCTNGPGNNNMYLNSANKRGSSGKALTFWDEVCTNAFEDSDGQLIVNLGSLYEELYVRFYIKFSPNYKWDSGGNTAGYAPQHKLMHIWRYNGNGNPFQFHGGQTPIFVPGLQVWSDTISYTASFFCDTNLDCNGSPSYNGQSGTMDFVTIGNGDWNSTLGDGQWHSMEVRVKMNTFNASTQTFNSDGVHEFWLDGVSLYSTYSGGRSGIPWSDNSAEKTGPRGFNYISFGGNNLNLWTRKLCCANAFFRDLTQYDPKNECSGTSCEQWYAVDDIVVSTTYIGPDGFVADTIPPEVPLGFVAN